MTQVFNKNIFGRNLELYAVTGKVIETKRWAETSVSSSGGGSVIAQGSGYINSPQIESTTFQKIEFWIKENESGQEKVINLTNSNFNVKNDQEVVVLYSKINNKDFGISFLYNKNANIFSSLNNEGELSALGKKSIFNRFFIVGFLYYLAILLTGAVIASPSFYWLGYLIVIALVVSFLLDLYKTKQKNELIDNEFIEFAYQSVKSMKTF